MIMVGIKVINDGSKKNVVLKQVSSSGSWVEHSLDPDQARKVANELLTAAKRCKRLNDSTPNLG